MKFRKFVLNIHSIIGVFLGLIFVMNGLTGSAIVFREEADRALNPVLMQVIPQSKQASIGFLMRFSKPIQIYDRP